ncbi:hypothetical protein JCM30471_27740 [Desulfuromonas carbonis]|uniref:DUF4492 domain-containing protein n=1 Tax=Desulfuromonas sp. DDH964 TaxID=1823759 RepID=UPI00078C10B8|nr:DUF4492 domain-containing protein [Desulfuromonas sp. DDH964]AMV70955.1 hypothetical protein DBW_0563 [Desulfuromonas sp. DDH964]
MSVGIVNNLLAMYVEGFRAMRLGRTLWTIILVKLILLYTLARLLFPDPLQENFANDRERADHVLGQLVRPPPAADAR